MIRAYTNVTVRQTDRQTVGRLTYHNRILQSVAR